MLNTKKLTSIIRCHTSIYMKQLYRRSNKIEYLDKNLLVNVSINNHLYQSLLIEHDTYTDHFYRNERLYGKK